MVPREMVPRVITLRLGLPTLENGPDTVMIHNASKGMVYPPAASRDAQSGCR